MSRASEFKRAEQKQLILEFLKEKDNQSASLAECMSSNQSGHLLIKS
jgi:hypothetical protein